MKILRIIFKNPISQYHPFLYFCATRLRRISRSIKWKIDRKKYTKIKSKIKSKIPLTYRVKKHQSVLIRKLGESDIQWQLNKIINLKLASSSITDILIRPNETFSFCQLVGNPTTKKGYVEGMELSFGEARSGIGGGICQIANLIHWLVLHSPLDVIQRSQHSFDPFPDHGRVLPFGSGAAIFYNYIDYQFYNPTKHTFQIRLWFSEKCLEGELRSSVDLGYVYHIFEKNHAYLKIGNDYYRKNEIWRHKKEKYKSGEIIHTECMTQNFAKVMYTPSKIDYFFDSMEDYQASL